MITLEKLLQREGFGSRKDCRRLIAAGAVEVDGSPCVDSAAEFSGDGTRLRIDGEAWECRSLAVLMLNKPIGYECSRSPTHHRAVLDLLPAQLARRGVQPVGRLDAETSGLLILTDDGVLNHRLTSPKHGVAKRYRVVLKHAVGDDWIARLTAGVVLRDSPAPAMASEVVQLADNEILMTIHEGRYHQVRRMIAASSNRVDALSRVAVGALELPADLAPGQWRWLAAAEIALLEGQAPAA